MNTITAKGGDIMTDMQFKSILLMVRQILKRADSLDDAREAIDEVLKQELTDSPEAEK